MMHESKVNVLAKPKRVFFVLLFKILTRQFVIRFLFKNPIRIMNFLIRDLGRLHKILIRKSQDSYDFLIRILWIRPKSFISNCT